MTGRNTHIIYMVASILLTLAVSVVSIPVEAQTKRALIVGISEYQQASNDAWGAIHGSNDADLISPVLERQGFSIVKISNKSATAKRIRKGLESTIANI